MPAACTSERCQMKRTIWKVIYCIKRTNKRRRNLNKFSVLLSDHIIHWALGDFNFSSHKKNINCGLSTCTQLKGNTVNLVSIVKRVHSVNFSNFSNTKPTKVDVMNCAISFHYQTSNFSFAGLWDGDFTNWQKSQNIITKMWHWKWLMRSRNLICWAFK